MLSLIIQLSTWTVADNSFLFLVKEARNNKQFGEASLNSTLKAQVSIRSLNYLKYLDLALWYTTTCMLRGHKQIKNYKKKRRKEIKKSNNVQHTCE